MRIKVKYIHNTQAVRVKQDIWTYLRNDQMFNFINDRLNGLKIVQPSSEQLEGAKGNY